MILPLIRWSHNIFSYASFTTHDGWCSLNDETVFCFFPCGSRCGSLPYLQHAIFFSDNKTNDFFPEFSMWFIITATTYSTHITNLILWRSSREKLEFFHLVYPSRTYSHCSGFHQSFASFIFGLGGLFISALGRYWQYMGTKVGVPILVCVLVSQAWRRSTDQGRYRKSSSATRWIIPKAGTLENYLCTTRKCRHIFSKTWTQTNRFSP